MPANFDRVASFYGGLERLAFGGALQRCRVALLDQLPATPRVLIAGEGGGRFLEVLVKRRPESGITVLDASARMLERARRRLAGKGNVQFIRGDLLDETIPLPEVDLVVTCFFLDCFGERTLPVAVRRLRTCLTGGGCWLWADFDIPDQQPMKTMALLVVGALYRFFGLTTGLTVRRLADPESHFRKCDLWCAARRTFLGGLLATAVYRVAARPSGSCNHPAQSGLSGGCDLI